MANCFLEGSTPDPLASKYALGTVYIYSKYCNLKCRHCWINPPYTDEVAVKEGEISLKELIPVFEECRLMGMGSVKLSGGEPFTRKDIFDFLNYFKENTYFEKSNFFNYKKHID